MENSRSPSVAEEDQSKLEDQEQLLIQLPKVKFCKRFDLYQFQAFWFPFLCIHGIISSQKYFQAKESDIILSSFPKSGTTWLKALTFSIVNRSRYSLENSPLLTTSAHELVRFLETDLYRNNQMPNLEQFPTPRVLATHTPYASLPPSILNSSCRIVYICRNPLDQFISEWQFIHKLEGSQPSLIDEAFEKCCNGIQYCGPIWEHVLGYWKASLEHPDKILFLKYEDLKDDVVFYMKRLADFVGCSFSKDEENQGMIEEISKLCSFENIKDLEVNKNGTWHSTKIKNSIYFRKGKVGDWKNYLTPSMAERMKKIMEGKLAGSGLTFKTS